MIRSKTIISLSSSETRSFVWWGQLEWWSGWGDRLKVVFLTSEFVKLKQFFPYHLHLWNWIIFSYRHFEYTDILNIYIYIHIYICVCVCVSSIADFWWLKSWLLIVTNWHHPGEAVSAGCTTAMAARCLWVPLLKMYHPEVYGIP